MSFDPSNRYQDRIESSASVYNNPYRLDSAPARAYETLQKNVRRKDSKETEQERLERHLLGEFQRNHFRLPAGRFVIIAEAGKYLVLAILLPPYIFFYGMPKWMLEQVSPPLKQSVEVIGNWIEKTFLRISAWTMDVFAIASERIRNLRKKEKRKKPVREGDNLFKLFYKDLKPYGEALKMHFQTFTEYLQNRIQDLFNKSKLLANGVLERVQKNIFSTKVLIEKWISNFSDAFSAFDKVRSWLKKSSQRVNDGIDTVYEASKDRLKKVYASIQIAGERAIELFKPVAIALLPPLIRLQSQFSKFGNKAFDSARKPIQVIREIAMQSSALVQEKCSSAIQWLLNRQMPFKTEFQRGINKVFNLFLEYRKKTLEKCLAIWKWSKRLAQPIKRKLLQWKEKARDKAKQFFQKSKDLAKRGCTIFKNGAKWTLAELHILPKRVFFSMKKLLLWMYRMLKKLLWAIRILLTWAKILTIHAIKNLSISKT